MADWTSSRIRAPFAVRVAGDCVTTLEVIPVVVELLARNVPCDVIFNVGMAPAPFVEAEGDGAGLTVTIKMVTDGAVLVVGTPGLMLAPAAVAARMIFTSLPVSTPLALTSQRKLAPETGLPDATAARQIFTSEPVRTPLPLTSRVSTRKEIAA